MHTVTGAEIAEHLQVRHRIELPPALGARFAVRDAAAAGIRRGRRDAADLDRPFHGVRANRAPTTFNELVACYVPRLKPHHRVGGVSAARLWGLPYPRPWTRVELLEIVVPHHLTPPNTRRVRGRRLAEERATTWNVAGVPVVDPVAALFTCAATLTVEQAAIMIDAMITDAANDPGLIPGRPRTSRADIEERLAAWARFPGCGIVRAALCSAREGVESPKETETRLMIVRAGLPEPVVQYEVREGGILLARVDLAYPDLRIAIEYEGDGHRTDKRQWRTDIRRQRDLEDRGWTVIRLTELDLRDTGAIIARIRRAVAVAAC